MADTAAVPTTLADLSGIYSIDPTHSSLGFVARHAMITKVRGSFTGFEGQAQVDGQHLSASTVSISIDASTVDTGNSDRDGHLRTGDFFDIATYPTWTFTSTNVEQTSETEMTITGDLTIKGTTQQVTIPFEMTGAAKDPYGNLRVGFEGSTKVQRADFGLTYNAALETGGVLISDQITLEIEISAIAA